MPHNRRIPDLTVSAADAGSEASWKAGITHLVLAVQMTRRLDIEDSDPVWERLAAVAYSFYQGAREALEGVQFTTIKP
jgi:hypothetical protein